MIIVKIFGGLGNQMFQYAAGLALARKKNTSLGLDLSFFENHGAAISRAYGLHVFSISGEEVSKTLVEKYMPGMLKKQLQRFAPWYTRTYIQEPHYEYTPDFFKISSNALLNGYWQSETYFSSIKDVLSEEFSLNVDLGEHVKKVKEHIKNTNSSVSLHIRRGDYVESKEVSDHIGAQPMTYYDKAVEAIKQEVTDPTFFVFSDDIEWAKDNVKFENVEFVSNPELKDYEEMHLMSQCDHNIIANSSFSWWGAWLNNNQNKIVIAPQNWFADKSMNTKDLIPENWKQV